MAASNAGNTDSLPTNEIDMEKSQQCELPNKCDSNDAMNGDPGSVDKSADAKNSRNIIRGFCTERNCLIAIIFLLAVIVIGLCVYVGILHSGLSGRLDRLEIHTQMNSELEESDGDLQAQISHLSKMIEGLKESLSSLKKTHRNDTNEIRTSTSTILTQINTSLSSSLLSFTNEAASNISKLNKIVQMDISSVRNHSLTLAQNVSVLTDRMSFLERRLYKLETNATKLQGSLRLVEGNLRLTKEELRNLSSQHFNLQRDYDASRVAIEQNTSLLFEHIRNHSSILGEHSRLLGEAVRNESVLIRRIDDALNLVSSQGQLITGIRSNVSVVENGLTGLRSTLTTKVGHLNTRIDDHVDWIQHTLDDQSQRLSDLDNTLDDQSQRLSNLDNQISQVESKLLSDAVHVVPLGLLLLSAISLFACLVIL